MDNLAANIDQFDELADEFAKRCRSGDAPTVEEYAMRFPALAAEIRELFPAIVAMEHAKSASDAVSGGPGRIDIERLGDFRIVREIGRGGMGVVYEAHQESLGRRVAVKVLSTDRLHSETRRRRFLREARTAAKLHHSNIVPIFGVGQQDGHLYYVMQQIDGVGLNDVFGVLSASGTAIANESRELTALARRLSRNRGVTPASGSPAGSTLDAGALITASASTISGDSSMSRERGEGGRNTNGSLAFAGRPHANYWRDLARLMAQAADALAYAHAQGVLHRDIKPANLLLDDAGKLWVADFGLAREPENEPLTQEGDFVGTLRYMAPEQFQGHSDAQSDVYALGITLYELATLRTAFAGRSGKAVIRAVLDEALATPRSVMPDMPRDLETIILKSTDRDAGRRYATAAAMRDDLNNYLADMPIAARRASLTERLMRWSRRNPALAVANGLAFALLITIAVVSTAAYVQVRGAEQRVVAALDGEKRQRQRAEATVGVAVGAIDMVFDELAPTPSLMDSSGDDDESDDAALRADSAVLSPETAGLLKSMLGFYQRLAQQEGGSRSLQLKAAAAQRRVAEILQRLGQFAESRAAFDESIARFEELRAAHPQEVSVRVELAESHNGIAELLLRLEQMPQAAAPLAAARELLEDVVNTPEETTEAAFALAQTYYLGSRVPPARPDGVSRRDGGPGERRAGAERFAGWMKERRDALDQAIAILDRLGAASPQRPEYPHLLARCLRDYPPSRQDRGEKRLQAAAILERLTAQHPQSIEFRVDLAETYAMWEGPEAMQYAERGVEMMKDIVRERAATPDYASRCVRMLMRLGWLQDRENCHDAARASVLRGVGLAAGLAQRFPAATHYAASAAWCEMAAARIVERGESDDDALPLLESAHRRLTVLSEQGAPDPRIADMLGRCERALEAARREAASADGD